MYIACANLAGGLYNMRRSELTTMLTLEAAIAPPASIGARAKRKEGYRTPVCMFICLYV